MKKSISVVSALLLSVAVNAQAKQAEFGLSKNRSHN